MVVAGGDDSASRCGYVHTPQGQGSNGWVDIEVTIPTPATYYVWGRIWGLDWSGDSMFVSLNGGVDYWWAFGSRGSWQWDRVGRSYYLSAGTHTLRFKTREDGARLDVVELTDDPGYVPSWVEGCVTLASSSAATPTQMWTSSQTTTDIASEISTFLPIIGRSH
jgi:hypothetical protein